ncbi:MAG: hypothetical protein SFU91_14080 [Chloroherpetonaceae bacterium]|nr:hypothetical protein [Chloroherpetonaceae bacterium]
MNLYKKQQLIFLHSEFSLWASIGIIGVYTFLSLFGSANFPILDDFTLIDFLNRIKG